jgi:hypothetical protein
MTTPSVEQQIAALRPTIGFAAHMQKWFLGSAALGIIAAIIFWHPVPLMIATFLAIVGFSEQQAGPHIVAAIAAYDSDTPTDGTVSIVITCWDTDNHYQATVREPGHPDWEYEFVPQGWQPLTRNYPAKIWRTSSNGQPVLAMVEEGILIPRYDPKPVDIQSNTTNTPHA